MLALFLSKMGWEQETSLPSLALSQPQCAPHLKLMGRGFERTGFVPLGASTALAAPLVKIV
jgi:hypothetical protein